MVTLKTKKTKVAQAIEGDPLKRDFRKFLFLIWKELNLPNPTPVQYDIAQYLQTAPKRCVIEAFRGVGKSFVTGAYVLWELYRDPQKKIMVVSASKERADAFSQFTKRLLSEVEWLKHLDPAMGSGRNTLIAFDVALATVDQSPSVKSVGITGQLTGSRADIIVADDIEVLNNSATQAARDKLLELVKEFDAILKPLPSSRIIYLGTPQTEMSIYNTLPERGYEIRVWTAETPENVDKYKGRLAPMILDKCAQEPVGTPCDPQRFEMEDLLERKLSYGKGGYALQFMLDTSLSDADKYPLKLSDLIVHSVNHGRAPNWYTHACDTDKMVKELPAIGLTGDYYYAPMAYSNETTEYQGKVMAIDPSGRGKDETSYAVGYMLNGIIYLAEIGGFNDGYSDKTLEGLCMIAKRHGVNEIIVEPNYGDGMFNKLLSPWLTKIHPCTLSETPRANTQKERRIIDTLEPVLSQHRLVVDPKVIQKDYEECERDLSYSLFHQLTRITYERGALVHDDRLDALTWMVGYWIDHMEADAQKTEAENKAAALDELLATWWEEDTSSQTWCSW